jgi:hypothetical protein
MSRPGVGVAAGLSWRVFADCVIGRMPLAGRMHEGPAAWLLWLLWLE